LEEKRVKSTGDQNDSSADSIALKYGLAKMLVVAGSIFLVWLTWRSLNPSLDTTLFRELAVAAGVCAMIWNSESVMLALRKRAVKRAEARYEQRRGGLHNPWTRKAM